MWCKRVQDWQKMPFVPDAPRQKERNRKFESAVDVSMVDIWYENGQAELDGRDSFPEDHSGNLNLFDVLNVVGTGVRLESNHLFEFRSIFY
jgi:hypothetical protein